MTRHRTVILLSALLGVLFGSACGIKPKNLDQPAGTEKNDFPRDYPMPGNE